MQSPRQRTREVSCCEAPAGHIEAVGSMRAGAVRTNASIASSKHWVATELNVVARLHALQHFHALMTRNFSFNYVYGILAALW